MTDLQGEKVKIFAVVTENRPCWCFHGTIVSETKEEIELDDFKEGLIVFKRSNIRGIYKMGIEDYNKVAQEFPRWAIKRKFRESDERIKKNFEELIKGKAK